MKKILFAFAFLTLSISSSTFASTPALQIGGDFVVPYRTDAPSGRLGMLAGGHIQAYILPALTFDVTGLFGVENDNGFAKKPIYVIPGITAYLPTMVVQPYLTAGAPFLLNNGKDIGVQGGAGLQLGLMPGIVLRYSVDVAYYFDAKSYIVNWVHAGVAVSF